MGFWIKTALAYLFLLLFFFIYIEFPCFPGFQLPTKSQRDEMTLRFTSHSKLPVLCVCPLCLCDGLSTCSGCILPNDCPPLTLGYREVRIENWALQVWVADRDILSSVCLPCHAETPGEVCFGRWWCLVGGLVLLLVASVSWRPPFHHHPFHCAPDGWRVECSVTQLFIDEPTWNTPSGVSLRINRSCCQTELPALTWFGFVSLLKNIN